MTHPAPTGARHAGRTSLSGLGRRMVAQVSSAKPGQRLDIQGVRALAILLVLVYHLWPSALPGGFIGVDVFFVVSGFLIVGGLMNEVRRTGTVSVGGFYARRIRRLLPASAVTLLLTAAAALIWLPSSRWASIARDLFFSALQVQNWGLAVLAGDYAEAGTATSPLQHFWSLAVEEQFYIVVPLLFLPVTLLARRRPDVAERWLCALLGALGLASFAYSVWFSPIDHGMAYYSTLTRVWQLLVGAGLAIWVSRRPRRIRGRGALGALGLAMVLTAAVVLTTAMPFPGWIAAVPTVGAALILLAGSPGSDGAPGVDLPFRGVSRALATRPAVLIGDISYSLYLVHWPIIVVVSALTPLTTSSRLVIIAGSVLLAALMKVGIEDPFRYRSAPARRAARRRPTSRRRRQLAAYGQGLALTCSVLLVAGAIHLDVERRSAPVPVGGDHPGAAAFGTDWTPPPGSSVVPAAVAAAGDSGPATARGCIVEEPATATPADCVFGEAGATTRYVLLGDSHAAQWASALDAFGRSHHVRVEVRLRNGCPPSAAPISNEAGVPLSGCTDATAAVIDALRADPPARVLLASMNPDGYAAYLNWTWPDPVEMAAGFAGLIDELRALGSEVSVIRDTPTPVTFRPIECVEQHGPDSPECTVPGVSPDPLAQAATDRGLPVIDLTPHLCDARGCPAVIGNVLVYRDNHLTDTFARSLAPYLDEALRSRP